MIPVHKFLESLEWDKDFSKGFFEIEFLDEKTDEIMRISLKSLFFDDASFLFKVTDRENISYTIPALKINKIFKDKILIWKKKE